MRHRKQMGAGLDGNKYSDRVEAILAPSRLGRRWAALAALATLALALVTPVEPPWHGLAACTIALAWVRAAKRLGAPLALRLDAAGVSIGGVDGDVSAGSFVAPWLTTIRWRPRGAWIDRSVAVLPDMLPAEDFRRLRVLLRLRR